MRNNYKAMSNKRLASTIWKKLGSPLVGAYVILSIIYFILMGCTSTGISGPTALGTFLLGRYIYVVAYTLCAPYYNMEAYPWNVEGLLLAIRYYLGYSTCGPCKYSDKNTHYCGKGMTMYTHECSGRVVGN